MRTRLLAPFAAAFLFAGCGIIEKDFEGNVRFSFTIDDEDDRYESIESFDPNSNEQVKEHRDNIKEGDVLEISLELVEVLSANRAQMVAGQVDVRVSGQGDDAWIMAVGQWSGIPVYDDTGSPALGQKFKLDLPVETQNELSRIVFEETSVLDFRLNGVGTDFYGAPLGPVGLKGEVDVHLSGVFSAP